MNKQQFLDALAARLSALSAKERKQSLDYYAEMIDDRVEEGMTQEAAVASLEGVDVIAARILAEHPKKRRGNGVWIAVGAAVVLLCAALFFGVFAGVRMLKRTVREAVRAQNQTGSGSVTAVDEPARQDEAFLSDGQVLQFDTQDVRTIDVRWVCGDVHVTGTNEDSVRLWEERTGTLALQNAQVSQNGGVLRVDFGDVSSDMLTRLIEGIGGGHKDLWIEVPLQSGEISLQIKTNAGSILVQDASVASCRLETDAGNVSFDGVFEKMNAFSSMGNVTVAALGGGIIRNAETACGNVTVSGAFTHADASTSMGNVQVTCQSGAQKIDASSDMGDVELYLPADLGFALEAETSLGSVQIDIPDCMRRGEVYIAGDGALEAELETDMGNVYVGLID